jgi:phosphoheptose isomerase
MPAEPVVEVIRRGFQESAEIGREFVRAQADVIGTAVDMIVESLRRGNKIVIVGNGGSAGDAQHFAAELVGRFGKERRALPALALTTDTSILTAIGNDYGFEEIFARQVKALAGHGDVLMVMTTSGRSPNVVKAVAAARQLRMGTIALTGGDGGDVSALVDIAIVVPSRTTARIQEIHLTVIHILSELIETTLFSNEHTSSDLPKGIVGWRDLMRVRETWRREGRIVVWTNGCFDVLHVGHLHALKYAKHLGDILVVGVNTDDAVRQLKGSDRPIFALEDRMRMLDALDLTDYVVAFEGLTPEEPLAELQPDVHVKGNEYAPPSGKPMPERAVVEGYGGRIAFVPTLPGRSTSEVIRRMERPHSQVPSTKPSS